MTDSELVQEAATSRKRRSPSAVKRVLAVIFWVHLVVALGSTGLYIWKARPLTVQVASVSWEYVLDVERYQVLDREGFAEERSEHAFDIKPQGQRHHHGSRAEPRYADWYTWKVWDWGHDRTLKTSGKSTADPHWPSEGEMKLNQGVSLGEQERVERRERYTVVFSQEGEQRFTYKPQSLAEFQRYTPGSEHRIRLQGSAVSVVTE